MSRTTMNKREALAWVAETFAEPVESLNEGTRRDRIPAWDSLGVLALMASLDEKFDIRISEKEIGALNSVGDILDVLKRHGALRPD